MPDPVLCVVTIHGIGFEQAPTDGAPGYADGLHERLSRALGADLLGDDPNRNHPQSNTNGAIYVQSLWPVAGTDGLGAAPPQPSREEGLRRLGSWASRSDRIVDTTNAPLVPGAQRIAHVALVYSHLEAVGPHVGAAGVAIEMAAVSLGHYASIMGLARMAFTDVAALLGHQQAAEGGTTPSLQVRIDTPPGHSWFRLPFGHSATAVPAADSGGLLALVRNLEDDVAAYVSRNDLRERVRGFVREALLRLVSRDDVAGVVVNAHSNGTVVGFDVLRDLPPFLAAKVHWFVTAGSPLRKYAELFNWGTDAGSLGSVRGWTNFWDRADPVADPLAPPATWRRGDDLPPASDQTGLFQCIDPSTGSASPVPIDDRVVDNVHRGGGGSLPAHDYWDNDEQVVAPLAQILRQLMA